MIYSRTRTVFRVASLDLLDLEVGGGSIWGTTARDAADMLVGRVPSDERKMGRAWLRTRAIARIARACLAAFSPALRGQLDERVIGHQLAHARMCMRGWECKMREVAGDPMMAASLVGTPLAYYRAWWRPTLSGEAITRRMTADDAERRAGLERALQAQRAQADKESADRWRNVHEDVTKVRPEVRPEEPAVSERPTRPYAVKPPK